MLYRRDGNHKMPLPGSVTSTQSTTNSSTAKYAFPSCQSSISRMPPLRRHRHLSLNGSITTNSTTHFAQSQIYSPESQARNRRIQLPSLLEPFIACREEITLERRGGGMASFSATTPSLALLWWTKHDNTSIGSILPFSSPDHPPFCQMWLYA
ncbi:uncharacterized protein LY79DRAFT_295781 [Colletotrichum navitas]|uniref:Uncharacterized protein n=1 Tax=Colletotrichum navitas TaxID=681940 RepID=A0AAD8V282_9PEZI|nr:uncharacterized protein LY79DRAFT_295781 [Colletotrichum navitas]KAK1580686.1 hypothetical protein LY79DRAFT_295781 [Colletotrichum navitas]